MARLVSTHSYSVNPDRPSWWLGRIASDVTVRSKYRRSRMNEVLSRDEELIGEHLDYEIKMLHETRKALRGETVSANVIANALMESFCIHARNLNEFFFENERWPDVLKARDFAIREY